MQSRRVTVEPEHDGLRLDNFLTALLPELSRSQIQRLIKDGRFDGLEPRSAREHRRASRTDVHGRRPGPGRQPRRCPRRCRCGSCTRIPTWSCWTSRPAWSSIPAAGHDSGTLVNALLHHVTDLSGIGGELRPGIVHRLDRGTSGVMVVAKNDRAHQELSRQFHDREVEKEYVALVWGVVHAGRRIDEPIGRDPNDRQKMSTRARRAREAVTRVTFARHFKGVSLLKVAIATGRTHQIRVHLNAIGHPIVGDAVYGGVHRRVPANLRAVMRLERPFLHSARLSFTHPADGTRVEFESPLPPDLDAVLEAIAEAEEV